MATRNRISQRGVTLLELMMAMSILTVVMGVLFTLSISIGDTAKLQDVKVVNNDEARRALQAGYRIGKPTFPRRRTGTGPGW